MKVGLNLLFLGEGSGGVGRYAVELAEALSRREDVELEIFVSRDAPGEVLSAPWTDRVKVTRLPVRRERRLVYLGATFAAAPFLAALRRLDVFHSPANVGPFFVPGVKTLITVHDLIWLKAGNQWDSQEAIDVMRRATDLTVPRVDRLITDSRASREDLAEYLGPRLPPIDVIHLGVKPPPAFTVLEEAALRERFGLGTSKVLLCVAQKRRYKRQDVLVRALQGLPNEVVLVLPGAATEYERELRSLAAELGVQDRVIFPDWVSEAELDGLYRLADCFALPSELEGFGLPVLEAMACGVPVVCSDRASLPEVSGEAALMVDPDDPMDVLDALMLALYDEHAREDLRVAGLARAAACSWDETARETVRSYEAAVRERV